MKPEEKVRFHRQLIHEGFNETHQKRLRDSTILLAGIGGIGGAIAYSLTGAGIGRLLLVHSGNLTESNLNRQTLMREDAVGRSRVVEAKRRLKEFSSFTTVEAHDIDISETALERIAGKADLIIDARHNFTERRAINRVAARQGIPLIFAAMDSMEMQMAFFDFETTGCLDCLYPDDPPDWDPFGFPVFGAVAHVAGAMAAAEAIKHLSGYGKPAYRLTTMDLNSMIMKSFPLRRMDSCRTCGKNQKETVYEPYYRRYQGRDLLGTQVYQCH